MPRATRLELGLIKPFLTQGLISRPLEINKRPWYAAQSRVDKVRALKIFNPIGLDRPPEGIGGGGKTYRLRGTDLTYCRVASQFFVCDTSVAFSICDVSTLQCFLPCARSVRVVNQMDTDACTEFLKIAMNRLLRHLVIGSLSGDRSLCCLHSKLCYKIDKCPTQNS